MMKNIFSAIYSFFKRELCQKKLSDEEKIFLFFLSNILVGAYLIVSYGCSINKHEIIFIFSFIAASSVATGGFIGFLFGIPKAGQDGYKENDSSSAGYKSNTNLEQISDWLTKILVGVSLTQLPSIIDYLKKVSIGIDHKLNGHGRYAVIVAAMIVYFFCCGFFLGYLFSRILLERVFNQAIYGLNDIKKEVEQAKHNQEALRLVEKKIDISSQIKVEYQELISGIGRADYITRSRIFYKAKAYREENSDKPERVKLAKDIFKCLIDTDMEKISYNNYWQIALSSINLADFVKAEKNIEKAINIRNEKGESGWGEFEVLLALCKIENNKKEDGKYKDNIVKDIHELIVYGVKRSLENKSNALEYAETKKLIEKEVSIVNFLEKYPNNEISAVLND